MALYEITITSKYFQQVCINRWNYVSSGIPAAVSGSFGLVHAFGGIEGIIPGELPNDTLLDTLRLLSVSAVDFVDISCFSVYDAVDFYTTPFPSGTDGHKIGEAMSPTQAYGFRTNRTRRDIRRGTKRFVGCAESFIDSGGIVDNDATAIMDTLATYMGDNLEYDDEGNILTYTPVIVHKERHVDIETGKVSYRYYDTLSEQSEWLMSSIIWEPYPEVRTQVSRQYARGI